MVLFTVARQQNNSSSNLIIPKMKPAARSNSSACSLDSDFGFEPGTVNLAVLLQTKQHICWPSFTVREGEADVCWVDLTRGNPASEAREEMHTSVQRSPQHRTHCMPSLKRYTPEWTQMQPECLLEAAAASRVWPILKIAQLDEFTDFFWQVKGTTITARIIATTKP